MSSTSNCKRTVLYLTDPKNLSPINSSVINHHITHIIIGMFHLGYGNEQQKTQPYIHLGNVTPDQFPQLWSDVTVWQNRGVKVMASLGGWGVGDYRNLFSDYHHFYPVLMNTLCKYNMDGLDLDIEESDPLVNTANVRQLLKDLRKDCNKHTGDFLLSSAPVASALTGGGTVSAHVDYNELLSDFDFYNLQFYGWGNLNGSGSSTNPNYDTVIDSVGNNDTAKIVAGTLTNPANGNGYLSISTVASLVADLVKSHKNFGGIMGWNAPNALNIQEKIDPAGWCKTMTNVQK